MAEDQSGADRAGREGAAAAWPVEGVRVLDLSSGIAGGYCTKLLVDAGAEVLKVEPPEGDPLRRWTAAGAPPPGEDGALFQYLAASKRSLVLGLGRAADRERLLELAAGADLLVESFGPGGLAERGIEPEALRRRNPRLSIVSISAWGLEGPWARRPATEWTQQAAIGMTARRGLPERGPVGCGGQPGEWVAGTYAAVGALAALFAARRSGRGQHVDLSRFEAMLLCMTQYHDLNGQFQEGRPLPQYVDTPSVEPARDGWVGFATITPQQWRDFCVLIERPELAADKRYFHTDERMKDLAFIQGAIRAWTKERTVAEIVEAACALRLPVAPVGDGESLPRIDHFVARGVFERNPGGFLQPRVPYRLERTPLRPLGRAPRLGEAGERGWGALGREDRVALSRAAAGRPGLRRLREDAAEESRGSASSRPSAVLRGGRPFASQADSTAGAGDETALGPSVAGGAAALPFAGLRVIDLSAFWAGPFLTWHLAALGADVVKLESIQRPDGMRFVNAIRSKRFYEAGSIFHGANAGKRGVTLRLDAPQGRALLERLLAGADLLVENFSVRVLSNLGLDCERLLREHPRLIVVRMPSWGLDGPWRDRVGWAMTVEQACGLAWRSGYPDLPLVVNMCDALGGLHAFVAVCLALEHRRRTGEGQLVEIPLVEPGLAVAAELVIERSAYGRSLGREGNRGPEAAPQGVYACADGEVALSVPGDAEWHALRRALGDPEWARRPELGSALGRRAAHDRIDERLCEAFAGRPRATVVEELSRAGVPIEPLVNAHAVMPNPQLQERRFFQELEHAVVGRRRYPGLPMRFSSLGPDWHRRPPPLLGEHNREILAGELGLSEADLDRLRAAAVIGDRPAFL